MKKIYNQNNFTDFSYNPGAKTWNDEIEFWRDVKNKKKVNIIKNYKGL